MYYNYYVQKCNKVVLSCLVHTGKILGLSVYVVNKLVIATIKTEFLVKLLLKGVYKQPLPGLFPSANLH